MESALRSGVAHSRPVVSSFYEILESCLEWLGSGLSFVKRGIRCGYMWIDDAAAKERSWSKFLLQEVVAVKLGSCQGSCSFKVITVGLL